MEFKEIQTLMQNFEDSDIRELEINQDSFQLYLSKNKQTHKHEDLITTEKTEQTTSVKKKKANKQPTLPSQNITAPLVGTVYLQPTPDADPYVRSGDHVKKGDVVCVIEAMKMMTEKSAAQSMRNASTPVKESRRLLQLIKGKPVVTSYAVCYHKKVPLPQPQV